MMRRIVLLSVMVVLMLVSACTMNRPVAATSNPIGEKVGVFTQTSWFGFPPAKNNKAAIVEAARNAGITEISTVDHNTTWIIFVMKYETIVTGN
ncbi:MAG TPA: protein trl (tRNA-associated locus protein) [Candidatus Cloacimonetes bacterium]|nr:protein trl (tRNA-associated locus protein) [Candidatus Cloacimonadota bacterium]